MHYLEAKLIECLKQLGDGVTPQIIAETFNLDLSKVLRAIEWLKYKGIIKVEEEEKIKVQLTERGKRYLEIGLPERRIYNVLLEGPKTFTELMKEAKVDKNEISVVIGNWKKIGLIEFREGKSYLDKKLHIDWIGEELLKLLEEPKFTEEIPDKYVQILSTFKDRGLVETKLVKIKRIYLIKDVNVDVEGIELLTPEMLKKGTWKGKKFRKFDVLAPVGKIFIGKKHPYKQFVDEVKEKLVGLGFEEMWGPIVESEFYNNDALFMPQDHPARDIHDIFYLKYKNFKIDNKILNRVKKVHEEKWRYKFDSKKSGTPLLRSQTTAVSVRMLYNNPKIPGKYFTVDRVFRPDVIDWKHLIEFEQLDGIVLGEKITIRHLLGLLKMFAEEIMGVKKIRFKAGYFPFTEPSVELFVKYEGEWMEIGGAGVFRKEVTQPAGIKVPVIAWGLGILRMYLVKNKINDMRKIFSTDLNYLREAYAKS